MFNNKFFCILVAFLISLLAGCGSDSHIMGSSGSSSGGGGTSLKSTIISGTASAGAAIEGTVSLRDSSTKPQPVVANILIASDGHYSVDTAGLTPPFVLTGTGTVGGHTVSLTSLATSSDIGGNININPFTNLITTNLAGGSLDTFVKNQGFASVTTAQVSAQSTALTNLLAPALSSMGLPPGSDFLHASIVADGTGLDRFMDTVQVNATDPSAETITNLLAPLSPIVINATNSTTSISSSGTLGLTGLTPAATPIDGIRQSFATLASLFATSVPSPTDPTLLALFNSNFLVDGISKSTFLLAATSQSGGIGLTFSNVQINSVDPSGTMAEVSFVPLNGSGDSLFPQAGVTFTWQMVLVNGVWQFNGDQRLAAIRVNAIADQNTCNPADSLCTMSTSYSTGLSLKIDNVAAQAIGSALVTGPGLPSGGVILEASSNGPLFTITSSNANNPGCSSQCAGGNTQWNMSDAEIAQVSPNSSYTVVLYDLGGANVVASYNFVVPVAPVLNTALASLSYPSISGEGNLASLSATTLTPTWIVPSNLAGGLISLELQQPNPSSIGTSLSPNLNLFKLLVGSSGTATLAITAPSAGGVWTSGVIQISAQDQNGGEVVTNYQ